MNKYTDKMGNIVLTLTRDEFDAIASAAYWQSKESNHAQWVKDLLEKVSGQK